MESLIETLKRTLKEKLTLRQDGTIVVALSGGADSVALLSALSELGYDCIAAHCNFHLRGEESLRDMRFVESMTERMDIDLYVKDFDVPAAMAATGESVEMACRRLRYEWFDELLTTLKATELAVGHHREDNVETFFLNLARGTGIAGLTGMDYRRGYIVRPLLGCSREQIENYLEERGLGYVTDSSNASDKHLRNRLRNRLLPLFENLLPGSLEGVERTMAMLSDARSVYDAALCSAAKLYGSVADGRIDVGALSGNPDARVLLFELLRPAGFTMTQAENILADPGRSGAKFTSPSGGYSAELSRGVLEIAASLPTLQSCGLEEYDVRLDGDIEIPVGIDVELHDCTAAFSPEKSPRCIYLDAAALEGGARWTIRRWRQGDRMRPFGMSGSRLVSDIFSDAKMTPAQKRSTWLLLRNGRIIWVVGVRASSYYPVGPRTKRYAVLRLR